MRGILKKKKWICLAAIIIATQMAMPAGSLPVYGTSAIKGLEVQGDSITKTRSDGENWSFTSPVKATYIIELFGPKANGANAGNGGAVSANVTLEAGQQIDIYLGPGAPVMNGARNGAKGNSGSGYGDTGIYKAEITSGGTDVMAAGGGGAQGNPGAGDGSQISQTTVYIDGGGKCATCGWQAGGYVGEPKQYAHYHIVRNGSGGQGGNGAHGGMTTVNAGAVGANGSSAAGWSISGLYVTSYNAGSAGGAGGDGGASYANPLYCADSRTAGLSTGESKVVITMGEEALPPFDAMLIMNMKKEILEAIASIKASSSTGTPEITVVQGKAFNRMIPAYPQMPDGSSGGVTVENADKTNQTINVSGCLNTPGSREIVINGNTFVFHVVTEPDSANVTVVFD